MPHPLPDPWAPHRGSPSHRSAIDDGPCTVDGSETPSPEQFRTSHTTPESRIPQDLDRSTRSPIRPRPRPCRRHDATTTQVRTDAPHADGCRRNGPGPAQAGSQTPAPATRRPDRAGQREDLVSIDTHGLDDDTLDALLARADAELLTYARAWRTAGTPPGSRSRSTRTSHVWRTWRGDSTPRPTSGGPYESARTNSTRCGLSPLAWTFPTARRTFATSSRGRGSCSRTRRSRPTVGEHPSGAVGSTGPAADRYRQVGSGAGACQPRWTVRDGRRRPGGGGGRSGRRRVQSGGGFERVGDPRGRAGLHGGGQPGTRCR